MQKQNCDIFCLKKSLRDVLSKPYILAITLDIHAKLKIIK